jgi:hypothetical protein
VPVECESASHSGAQSHCRDGGLALHPMHCRAPLPGDCHRRLPTSGPVRSSRHLSPGSFHFRFGRLNRRTPAACARSRAHATRLCAATPAKSARIRGSPVGRVYGGSRMIDAECRVSLWVGCAGMREAVASGIMLVPRKWAHVRRGLEPVRRTKLLSWRNQLHGHANVVRIRRDMGASE